VSPERVLRAKRQPPPPRLVDPGEGGLGEKPRLRLNSGPEDSPITLMRLGAKDLDAAGRAIAGGARPSAIVTGMGGGHETALRARRLGADADVAWLIDSLLFRTGLEGYRTAWRLQTLDYVPGRDADPYEPPEFGKGDLDKKVGRGVIGAQVDLGASGALNGAFVVDGPEDPWLPVNRRLLRHGTAAAAAWGAPLIAELPLRMGGFDDPRAQAALVNALSKGKRKPLAWLLMADGISDSSSSSRIVSALRLALMMEAKGMRVILARAGDLRRLFLAFGIAGVEFGLGRLLRFAVPDFTTKKRGPGPIRGPRIELPSLCCSLSYERSGLLVAQELVAEIDCGCPACLRVALGSSQERAAEHDAHAVCASTDPLAGLGAPERIERYDAELSAASHEWTRIRNEGGDLGRVNRVESQRRTLELAVQSGLLEPARIAAEASLLD
jgi:hypothetical protein